MSSISAGNKNYVYRDGNFENIQEPLELKSFNLLIRKMLLEIDSCKNKLERNRHSRIKNGILNIHSGEMVRFHVEHGHSIRVDYSLFA